MAINVAKSVENRIISGDLTTISTSLIRELVNNELMDRGANFAYLAPARREYLEELFGWLREPRQTT